MPTRAARAVARPGAVRARPRCCSARCTRARPTTTCCCRSTRTCTRSGPAPISPTCSCRRSRSAPRSCGPTAAATSRTTAPGSSSATRSCRSRSGAPASATSSRTSASSKRCSSPRSPISVSRRRVAPTGSPASGSATRRSRRSACGSRDGRTRARLRAQRRSRPHDVLAHRSVRHPRQGRHVARARCSARAPSRATSSTASSRGSPSTSATPTSNAKTSCGASSPTDLVGVHADAMAGGEPTRPTPAPRRCAGAAARTARAGRRRDRRPPARRPEWMRVRARLRRRVPRGQAAGARPRPAHGVRGGRAARTSSSAGPTAPPRS